MFWSDLHLLVDPDLFSRAEMYCIVVARTIIFMTMNLDTTGPGHIIYSSSLPPHSNLQWRNPQNRPTCAIPLCIFLEVYEQSLPFGNDK